MKSKHLKSVMSSSVVGPLSNSSGEIPMIVPCMKSSSEMQIKANVLLWRAKKVHVWAFLASTSRWVRIDFCARGDSGREAKKNSNGCEFEMDVQPCRPILSFTSFLLHL